MNPVPAIAIGVPAEPARTNDGVTVVIAGTGFADGGGGGGGMIVPVGPPPQPAINHAKDRTAVRRTREARFIDCFLYDTKGICPQVAETTGSMIPVCVHRTSTLSCPHNQERLLTAAD